MNTNEPPVADFTLSIDQLSVDLKNKSSDPDGTIESVRWELGDGATSTKDSLTYTYEEADEYTIRLFATDDGGATDTTFQSVSFDKNNPPTADFTYATDRLTVDLNSESSDPDGTIEKVQWELGDGTTLVEESPTHTYEETGEYTVSLTATDDGGAKDSTSQSISFAFEVFVSNQGNFSEGNGSVTLHDPDEGETAEAISNLNSIVQSIALRNDRLYLAANSGGRLDVFDADDQSQLQQLTGFSGPRYLTFTDDSTAFLTDQSFSGPSSVRILDEADAAPEKATSIEVPGTPEGLTHTDSRVYAALGGFSDTTLVAAIDPDDRILTETIDVGCAPRYAVSDRQDDVFVVCSDTAEVAVLNGSNGEEQARLDLLAPSSTVGPGQPAYYAPDVEELYIIASEDQIVRVNTATNEVTATIGPVEGDGIGAVGYDAVREELYVGRVPGFTERGTVTIHARDGTQTGSFQAGVAPTYIDFRRSEE